jgi:hypothetical protein
MQIQISCREIPEDGANTSDIVRSQFGRLKLGDRVIDGTRADNRG